MSQASSAGPRGPRMIDVARLAGVSHQTVSRVINNSGSVTPEVRQRVELAIERLRYRRHPAARALATSRSMSIGIVSFGLAQYGPSVALTGIAEEARRAGYSTSLVPLADVDRATMREALDHLAADAVDGIVVFAPVEAALVAMDGLSTGTPLVVFEPAGSPAPHRVVTDEVDGARIATRHLVELGHRTVHHVAGPGGWLGATARLAGWSAVLAESGLVARPAIEGDWSTPSGYAAGQVLANVPGLTAVFAANDQMALGVIRALTDAGRRVPEEVSVVGFDDVPEAPYFHPGLTTVRFDFAEVGRRAVSQILELMDGQDPGPVPPVRPEFIPRASTAAPRG